MAQILGSNQGVRVFAPQYPTQKGRVLGRLWYLPTLKTILIVWSLSYAKHTRKILWPLKIWCCSWHKVATFVSMDHFACDAKVFWKRFTWTRARPVLEIYLIPDTQPIFVFLYLFYAYLWLLNRDQVAADGQRFWPGRCLWSLRINILLVHIIKMLDIVP